MKIIQQSGNSKLVEIVDLDGVYKRFTIPVEENSIEFGIPYGIPFEDFTDHPGIPNELRRRGIWTLKDLLSNHNAALGAIQAAYNQDLATIIKLSKRFEGGKA